MAAGLLSPRNVIGEFYLRMEEMGEADWSSFIAPRFTSDQESETYPFLGMAPVMRQWIGERKANKPRENSISVPNLEFESTEEIEVKDLERDKTGQILFRVAEMARRAVTHWNSLLSTLILLGESTACYDGQFFYDTDHLEGDSGTQSNDLTYDVSAGTNVPTVSEMESAIVQSIQAIMGFKDDKGEPINEGATQFLVMVPLQLLGITAAALGSQFIAEAAGAIRGGQIRAMKNVKIDYVPNPRFTAATKFFTFRQSHGGAALIRQEEKGVQFDVLGAGTEEAIKHKRHLYCTYARRNVTYGYWQHSALTTLN